MFSALLLQIGHLLQACGVWIVWLAVTFGWAIEMVIRWLALLVLMVAMGRESKEKETA